MRKKLTERKKKIIYGIVWFVVIGPVLVGGCTLLRPDTSNPFGAALYIVMQLAVILAWLALAPIGGTPVTRWKLRPRMTWRQIRALRAGHLPMDIKCPAVLDAYERCFYAVGARRVYAGEIDEDSYGTLYITNFRVIFLHPWLGTEFPLENIGACTAVKKVLYAHTEKNNYSFTVRHPRAVADMIERMRLNGSGVILDMIMYADEGEFDDEPIKVKL